MNRFTKLDSGLPNADYPLQLWEPRYSVDSSNVQDLIHDGVSCSSSDYRLISGPSKRFFIGLRTVQTQNGQHGGVKNDYGGGTRCMWTTYKALDVERSHVA